PAGPAGAPARVEGQPAGPGVLRAIGISAHWRNRHAPPLGEALVSADCSREVRRTLQPFKAILDANPFHRNAAALAARVHAARPGRARLPLPWTCRHRRGPGLAGLSSLPL